MWSTDAIWALSGALSALVVMLAGAVVATEVFGHSRPVLVELANDLVERAVAVAARGNPSELVAVIHRCRRSRGRAALLRALGRHAQHDEVIAARILDLPADERRIRRWIEAEYGHHNPDRRASAIELCGSFKLPGYLDLVRLASRDPDLVVQAEACRVLLREAPDDGFGVLLRLIEEDGPLAADMLAAEAAGVDGGIDATTAHWSVRRQQHWGPSTTLTRLLPDSGGLDGDAVDPWSAARPFVGTKSPASPEGRPEGATQTSRGAALALIHAMLEHPDEAIRLGGAHAIALLGHPGSYMEIVPLLSDPSRFVRIGAARVLAEAGSIDLIDGLVDTLSDTVGATDDRSTEAMPCADDQGRIAALEALGTVAWEHRTSGVLV